MANSKNQNKTLTHYAEAQKADWGFNFSPYKSKVSDLLIQLHKVKGRGDREETRNSYRALVNQTSILADALNRSDRGAVLNAAKALSQKAAPMTSGPIASVARQALSLANSILNNSASMHHSDDSPKTYIASMLLDDDFMDSYVDDYR